MINKNFLCFTKYFLYLFVILNLFFIDKDTFGYLNLQLFFLDLLIFNANLIPAGLIVIYIRQNKVKYDIRQNKVKYVGEEKQGGHWVDQ